MNCFERNTSTTRLYQVINLLFFFKYHNNILDLLGFRETIIIIHSKHLLDL